MIVDDEMYCQIREAIVEEHRRKADPIYQRREGFSLGLLTGIVLTGATIALLTEIGERLP